MRYFLGPKGVKRNSSNVLTLVFFSELFFFWEFSILLWFGLLCVVCIFPAAGQNLLSTTKSYALYQFPNWNCQLCGILSESPIIDPIVSPALAGYIRLYPVTYIIAPQKLYLNCISYTVYQALIYPEKQGMTHIQLGLTMVYLCLSIPYLWYNTT